MSTLHSVVELYRKSNCPGFDGTSFSSEIVFTSEMRNIISHIKLNGPSAGRFVDLEVDGQDVLYLDELPVTGGKISYEFNVTQGSAERFYKNRSDFVTIDSLKKGEVPKNFYIAADNYFSHDTEKPSYMLKIEKICQLIVLLSKMAHFHDIKKDSKGSYFRLVFILHSESKSSSAVIETNLSEDMIIGSEIDINLISTLTKIDSNTDAHYIEKINTFRNTLIEFTQKTNCNFNNIVLNWAEICDLYINNLAVYMSAFSFHKARKEVSEAEIDYAEKTSKIISDIATKALAIPISLVAAIAIYQVSTKAEAIVAFIGVLLTSTITSLITVSQKKQLDRIIHAKEILFSSIEKRLEDEQSEIKIKLTEAQSELTKNEIFCQKVLDLMLALSWVPAAVGTLGLLQKII